MLNANPRTNPASEAVLERLTRLHPKIIDLSLSRVERLLAALGHPEQQLPPVVHVAGHQRQGLRSRLSTRHARGSGTARSCLYVTASRATLTNASSCRRLIDEDALVDLLEQCEIANDGHPITFFEITTAAAFLAFAREPPICFCSRPARRPLDATNVIDRPLVTAITPISYDHMQFLGDTLALIAGEKAGILKPGVPAAIGPQLAEAMQVIESRAALLQAPLHCHGRDWSVEPSAAGLVYDGRSGSWNCQRPICRADIS
jgi:dihydrofolate synthase/folylpolyglutamate synthase